MSLIFAMVFATRRNKSHVQVCAFWVMFIMVILCYADAIYTLPDVECWNEKVWALVLVQIAVPMLPLVIIKMLSYMLNYDYDRYHFDALYTIPLMAGVTLFSLVMIMGTDIAANLEYAIDRQGYIPPHDRPIEAAFYYLTVHLYFTLIFIEGVAVFIFAIYQRIKMGNKIGQVRRFFRGEAVRPAYLIIAAIINFCIVFAIRVVLQLCHLYVGTAFNILYSLYVAWIIYWVGFTCFISEMPTLTFRAVFGPFSLTMEGIEQMLHDKTSDLPDQHQRWLPAVRNLVEEKRLYLDPDISVDRVAKMLGTNQAYVSRAVNRELGITFRDYINDLRIEYAKQYMLANPQLKQTEISEACGFTDAVTFNKRFKQHENIPPRDWMERALQRLAAGLPAETQDYDAEPHKSRLAEVRYKSRIEARETIIRQFQQDNK